MRAWRSRPQLLCELQSSLRDDAPSALSCEGQAPWSSSPLQKRRQSITRGDAPPQRREDPTTKARITLPFAEGTSSPGMRPSRLQPTSSSLPLAFAGHGKSPEMRLSGKSRAGASPLLRRKVCLRQKRAIVRNERATYTSVRSSLHRLPCGTAAALRWSKRGCLPLRHALGRQDRQGRSG